MIIMYDIIVNILYYIIPYMYVHDTYHIHTLTYMANYVPSFFYHVTLSPNSSIKTDLKNAGICCQFFFLSPYIN